MTAELVDEQLPAVWCYARGMLGDDEAAREATRAAFRAADAIESGRGAPDRVQLLVRARLACRDADVPTARSAGERGAGGRGGTDTGDTAEHSGLRGGLAADLEALDDGDREALLLVDVLGLEVEQAARVADVAPPTVHERRHRAHERLVVRVVGEQR